MDRGPDYWDEIFRQIPIRETITRARYGIDLTGIVDGTLYKWIERGLKLVVLCNHGIGRSSLVAKELTRQGKPAVYVKGGFEAIRNSGTILEVALFDLNEAPYLAGVLTPEERSLYREIIKKMPKLKIFNDSPTAIKELSRLIG